ncbi:MAG: homogentisate 1,2-dioxygenase [Myxococcota bacterium]
MLDRLTLGALADKPHTVMRDTSGKLLFEHCFTRLGFDGAYTISYHKNGPMEDVGLEATERGWQKPERLPASVARRLFLGPNLKLKGRPLDARVVVLSNDDVNVALCRPDQDDDAFLANNDADDLYYLHEGSAKLETPYGALDVGPGDYVWLPRSLPYRFVKVQGGLWLHLEIRHGLRIPHQYLNPAGQLKMDAPYAHRDFRRPTSIPQEDAPSTVIIKRQDQFTLRKCKHSVLDVVGFDGFVYPIAFNIERFSPKTGQIHMPPPVHAVFAATGLIVCNFVPRLTDFHPKAIPCPYPHSSVDCDEMIFYCRGNFTSRRGVGPGAISLHPAGIPHGPHPGAYEASIGTSRTEELAVMVDTFKPLQPTVAAQSVEFTDYHASWRTNS